MNQTTTTTVPSSQERTNSASHSPAIGPGFPEGTRLATAHDAAQTTAILLIPHDGPHSDDLFLRARHWTEVTEGPAEIIVHTISLQHATILWQPRRAVIIASATQLEKLVVAVARFSIQELELQALECWIATNWQQLSSDSPLAFEIDSSTIARRTELSQQFQQSINWRARWGRLVPDAHQPPLYPPTLASQISERLRERTRLADRVDFVGTQLDLFDRVYDQCAQRVSEFVVAQRGHHLEWVIIILLSFQTVLLLLEHLVLKTS
ncbi:MAG: hypothetical protein ACKOBW_10345 [Planctomycetota bacterium]